MQLLDPLDVLRCSDVQGKARCLGTLCSFLPCQHFRGPPNVVADGACTDQRVAQARQACQEAIRG